jgi:predicted  nucleic acid-binding Zn-ribbon protein
MQVIYLSLTEFKEKRDAAKQEALEKASNNRSRRPSNKNGTEVERKKKSGGIFDYSDELKSSSTRGKGSETKK